MLLPICVVLLPIVKNIFGLYAEIPVVNTSLGDIRGLTATDGEYFMYLGIPYAYVNKTNPFGAAIPFPDFPNGLNATSENEMCPQASESADTIIGSLKCLNLNIYVPRSCIISETNQFPVLALIYSDKYITRSNEVHKPKHLVRQNIIVVTISYRLGPYGFMCLDTPEIPGNQGLKDQVIALRWIRRYIRFFGGDARKITLSGHGNDSENVDLHLYSPQELLFHQAILKKGISGSNIYTLSDRTVPLKLADNIGYKTKSLSEAITFLATVNPRKLVSASLYLDIQYGPCIEKHFNNVEVFVTNKTSEEQKVRNVSIIIHQIDEVAYIRSQKPITDSVYSVWLKNNFNFDNNRMREMEKIVRRFYIGDMAVSEENIAGVKNFVSDISSNHANRRHIEKYLSNGARKIYYSIFEYNSERNRLKTDKSLYNGGAVHGDKLQNLDSSGLIRNNSSTHDRRTINQLTKLWTNFVKFGDPTPEATDLLPVRWTPVINDALPYLAIGTELEMKQNPFDDRMQFWDLFYTLNRDFQK